MLPDLLPETFRNLPELRVFEALLTAGLNMASYGPTYRHKCATYGAHLQGSLTSDMRPFNSLKLVDRTTFHVKDESAKSSTYGQALNTPITNNSMKKLPELLPVTFRNLPELRGN